MYSIQEHMKNFTNNLIRNATKVKNIEKEIAGNNDKKIMLCNKKWKKLKTS